MSPRTLATAAAGLVACAALVTGAAFAVTPDQAGRAAQDLHTITYGGVRVDVPSDWHLSSAEGPGCIVSDSAAPVPDRERPYGIDDCQLRIITAPENPIDADDLYFPGDPVVCHQGNASVRWATAKVQASYVGPAISEYRRFTLPCVSRSAEQWFLGGPPVVVIQRLHMDPATEAEARDVVHGAYLPARRIGYPASYTGLPARPSSQTTNLAPVRLLRDGYGSTAFIYERGQSLQANLAGASIVYEDAAHDPHDLSLSEFISDVRNGFPGVPTGSAVVVTIMSTDGTGVDSVLASVAAFQH